MNPLDRVRGRASASADPFATRTFGTSREEAAAKAAGAGGASFTTGGSAAAAEASFASASLGSRSQLQ